MQHAESQPPTLVEKVTMTKVPTKQQEQQAVPSLKKMQFKDRAAAAKLRMETAKTKLYEYKIPNMKLSKDLMDSIRATVTPITQVVPQQSPTVNVA